jgi:NADH-quinone oxidoreductase subunit N
MNNFSPQIPFQINDMLNSLSYFGPEVWLGILFIVVFVADLIKGKNSGALCRALALAGMLIVIFKTAQQFTFTTGNPHFVFNTMLLLHRPSVWFKLVIDVIVLLVLFYMPWDKALRAHFKGLSDLYSITIASVLGLHLMVMAVNLLSIYLAIEMVSIASYLMVAYRSDMAVSTEAGMKYVLFGATSSAVMLYGISLLYGYTGTLDIWANNFEFVHRLALVNGASTSLALLLVMVGIGFKLSFVPMHFWVPDVYQGSSTPVTAYLSGVPKIAGFALLLNFLYPFILTAQWAAFDFRLVLSAVALVSMVVGNFAAIWQTNVKRLLAYSSIGHTGFALMAVVAFSTQGISSVIFYLAVYALANVGALMLTTFYANRIGAHSLDQYKGAGLRYPLPSVCFVIILISLAGLPITAGFNGKVLVFSAVYTAYQQSHSGWLLALLITGAATTVISLFYYIKIPLYLFLKRNEHHADDLFSSHKALLVLVSIISAVLIILGIFPQLIDNYMI